MPGAARSETRQERQALAGLTGQLAALEKLTVGELAERYQQLFGEPTRSRNKDYLRKRLAWRIQELASGGLSPRALSDIEALASEALPRWRSPKKNDDAEESAEDSGRDPRIPPVGTVLRREFEGAVYEAIVLQDGFEFRGKRYPNLSRIARLITGTNWNGYLFWRLQRRTSAGKDGNR